MFCGFSNFVSRTNSAYYLAVFFTGTININSCLPSRTGLFSTVPYSETCSFKVVQLLSSELLMRDFSTSEFEADPYFVSVLKEFNCAVHLSLKVVLFYLIRKLNFLDFDDLLFFLVSFSFLSAS